MHWHIPNKWKRTCRTVCTIWPYTCTHTYIYMCVCVYNIYISVTVLKRLERQIKWTIWLPLWSGEICVFCLLLYVLSCSVVSLCDPVDCSPAGSSAHGILQARILEWAAMPFSTWSSQPKDWTQVSLIAGGFFTSWATREARCYVVWDFTI